MRIITIFILGSVCVSLQGVFLSLHADELRATPARGRECVCGALAAVPLQRAALGHELKYTSVPRKPFALEASLGKGCPLF